jgi:Na+/H+ antiporter NhaD/arsenite permease-like protein
VQAPSTDVAVRELTENSAEVSEIVFFLLGAMTIVEIIDAHQGFKIVTDSITTRKPRLLLWVVRRASIPDMFAKSHYFYHC